MRFLAESGVLLSGSPDLARDRDSPGVRGSFTPGAALAALLAGTGLNAVPDAQGRYVLRSAPVAAPAQSPNAAEAERLLPEVRVTGKAEEVEDLSSALQADGRAVDGYRARIASSVGALGTMSLLDTPFSLSVVPRELIENVQAQSPDDIYKVNPSTRMLTSQGTGWTPVMAIRGFQTSDTAEDGLRRPYNHAAVVEDKERVEVLNGLSGFLYGASAPAGMINYVYKRPTQERLTNVTVGNYGGSQAYVHGDFGGRIDEAGTLGYRLNVVRQNGGTAVDDQKIDRTLVSAALDWQLSDRLLLELNAVYNNYRTTSPSAYWYFAGARPAALDASKNWSQPWIQDEFENTKLMAKLTYRLDEHVTLRGAWTRNDIDRPVQDHTMNSGTATTYTQLRQRAGQTKDTFDAAQALADIAFDTGSVSHKLTVGYYGYSAKSWATSYAPHTGYQGPYTYSGSNFVPEYVFPVNTTTPYYAGKTVNDNLVVGDQIRLNGQWSVLAGLNRSSISSESVTAAGVRTTYDKSRVSPNLSVLYKLAPSVTTYVSYIEGLEKGSRTPTSGVRNPNTEMPPMVSRQKEIGVKADLEGMLLTAALFDIEKAYEYLDSTTTPLPTYTQNGRQRHQGFEFTATGKLTRYLTLLGGVTWLDPSVRGGTNDGKEPINVAKTLAKIYAEYALPVPGLSLTGGLYYTGKQWATALNTQQLPAYTTADIGLRYATRIASTPATLRLTVNNVTDRNYWLNSYYLGAPRSVALSAQFKF